MSASPDFSRPFDTRRIGPGGVEETVVATAAEREALAAEYGLLGIDRLEADLALTVWSGVGVRIDGRLRASVVQACVVTLEPVPAAIDERFTLTYLPSEAAARDPKTIAEAEVIVHFDEDDPPDPLEGPVIDLGRIVAEQLALALDPYPRAADAKLPTEFESGAEKPSPFAALARLRDKE